MNMVRKGLLGDVLHAEGGYVHDLRMVKFNPLEEPWRLQHSVSRNGNLYPDHPVACILRLLDINHGDAQAGTPRSSSPILRGEVEERRAV